MDIFEREMQKAFLLRSASAETGNIELKINKIHHRVDEVTKLLKEEQLSSPSKSSAGTAADDRHGGPGINSSRTNITDRYLRSYKLSVFTGLCLSYSHCKFVANGQFSCKTSLSSWPLKIQTIFTPMDVSRDIYGFSRPIDLSLMLFSCFVQPR